jgi:chromosomal replication initiation ATPase DnaA
MSRVPQLALPLAEGVPPGPFIPAACNSAAYETLRAWPDWPGTLVYVFGPEACGKSHLAAYWRELSGGVAEAAARLDLERAGELSEAEAVAIDALEELADEAALFHLYNAVAARSGALLVTARAAPSVLPIRLPDLSTRLKSATAIEIGAPDDAFLGELLIALAERRQIALSPAVAAYCVRRMERSQRAAVNLIDALDRQSLAAGRPVTRDIAAMALSALGF